MRQEVLYSVESGSNVFTCIIDDEIHGEVIERWLWVDRGGWINVSMITILDCVQVVEEFSHIGVCPHCRDEETELYFYGIMENEVVSWLKTPACSASEAIFINLK